MHWVVLDLSRCEVAELPFALNHKAWRWLLDPSVQLVVRCPPESSTQFNLLGWEVWVRYYLADTTLAGFDAGSESLVPRLHFWVALLVYADQLLHLVDVHAGRQCNGRSPCTIRPLEAELLRLLPLEDPVRIFQPLHLIQHELVVNVRLGRSLNAVHVEASQ
ncbi:hypothetical protein D3C76_1385260 [compost metagenome]